MILFDAVVQACDMTQYGFLDKWALSLPLKKREEFKADFLKILSGKTINNKETELATAYREINDDMVH